jgi:glucose/arabinose dehydrogenase
MNFLRLCIAWLVMPSVLAACGGGGAPSASDAPVANVTAPAAFAANLAGILTLSAAATDDVGVSTIEIQLDGERVGTVGTSSPHSVNVDTNAYASGQHVVRARATDVHGNISAWNAVTVEFGGSRPIPAGFSRDQSWITGLTSATAFAQTPDGRLLVAEQGGALRVVKTATLLATPMLNVTVDSTGERGLLGVAVHPDFASNGHIYVHYTSTETSIHNRISRFTVTGDVAGAEEKLIDLPTLGATNHNGGAIHFGIDGKLYAAVGDNAVASNSQDLSNPLGKILRFNYDGSIPADNPICTTSGNIACAIWAYGLRNPFTFAVNPDTGRMHINDVGQSTWEEINLGAPGANYGWPASEGPDNVSGSFDGPLFTYKHSSATPPGSGPGGFFVGFSITGGTFYPAAGPFPANYRNSYYFADFVSRFVGRFDYANNAAYAFATVDDLPVDLLAGSDGALYVLTRAAITRISAP